MGKVIEICPFIEVPKSDLESIEHTILITYVYFFGKDKERILMALGFGSMYNHSYHPNAVYKIKPKTNTIEFIATKDIKENEEIVVNYINENMEKLPLWFEK